MIRIRRSLPTRDPARVAVSKSTSVGVLFARGGVNICVYWHTPREQRGASRTPLAPMHAQQRRGYTRSPTIAVVHQARQLHRAAHTRTHTLLRPDGPTARQTVSASSSSDSDPTTVRVELKKGDVRTNRGRSTHRKKDCRSARRSTPHRARAPLALPRALRHYH